MRAVVFAVAVVALGAVMSQWERAAVDVSRARAAVQGTCSNPVVTEAEGWSTACDHKRRLAGTPVAVHAAWLAWEAGHAQFGTVLSVALGGVLTLGPLAFGVALGLGGAVFALRALASLRVKRRRWDTFPPPLAEEDPKKLR